LNGISEIVGSIPIGSTIHIHYLPRLSGCTILDIADLVSLNWRRQYPQTCTCPALIVSAQSSSDARPIRPEPLDRHARSSVWEKLIIRQKATNVLFESNRCDNGCNADITSNAGSTKSGSQESTAATV
jgi:hypothetical protein